MYVVWYIHVCWSLLLVAAHHCAQAVVGGRGGGEGGGGGGEGGGRGGGGRRGGGGEEGGGGGGGGGGGERGGRMYGSADPFADQVHEPGRSRSPAVTLALGVVHTSALVGEQHFLCIPGGWGG